MRQGSEVILADCKVKGIPEGRYHVQVDEATGNVLADGTFEMKQFELEVFSDTGHGSGGIVRRLV